MQLLPEFAVAVVGLAIFSYYDIEREREIPAWIALLWFGLAAILFFARPIPIFDWFFIIGLFLFAFLMNRKKMLGDLEVVIFPALYMLFGVISFAILIYSVVLFYFAERPKLQKHQRLGFTPFLFVPVLILALLYFFV